MAYVYADMDALAEYQQAIVQTLTTLRGQIGCKDDLIAETKVAIRDGIQRAEEAEDRAEQALRAAEDRLQSAEALTREHNANLAEDQSPMETADFYYEDVEERQMERDYAAAHRMFAQQTQENFEAYVRSYNQQQQDAITHFEKLLAQSGKFMEGYIKKLVEVKKATAMSGESGASGKQAGKQNSAEAAAPAAASPAAAIRAAGEQWADSLTKQQYAAVSAYTGSSYVDINAALRGLTPGFPEGCKEKAVLIHQALSASSLPQACTVYRGASATALNGLQNLPDHQLVGSFFSDNGFMSTSLNKEDSFKGEIRLVISVPAGAKGAYVGYVSQLGHSESEVLFDIGAVMRITKVERDGQGKRIIYAQMM